MKAVIYEGPQQMNVRQTVNPIPTEDEVLIRVVYSGICGSELSGYLGHNSLRTPPMIFGHEFSGIVAQMGEKAARAYPHLRPGTRVTANPLITCGQCQACLSGNQQLCSVRQLLSASLPGSNAEYVKIPARFVYPLEEHVTFEQGAFVEPLACGVRVAEAARLKPDHRVMIIGMGPIGLFAMQAVQAHGVKEIVAVDRNPQRLEMAAELGAIPLHPTEEHIKGRVGANGFDVVIDAVGAAATRSMAVECVGFGGKVIWTGLHEAESQLPINMMIRKEISCIGTFAYSASNFQTALQWIADGRIRIKDEWVVKAPFEQASEWYSKLVSNPGNVAKVLLHP
ncbi:zinc-binding dehydrogenase [Paenibacillus sp. HJGM_3]|uniref:zinc-dependent alcohol dehydrogenase n=1 Tax=Paenibacillus sp. HJGM_3 TaxID=3379816 RepID=UPI00385AA595